MACAMEETNPFLLPPDSEFYSAARAQRRIVLEPVAARRLSLASKIDAAAGVRSPSHACGAATQTAVAPSRSRSAFPEGSRLRSRCRRVGASKLISQHREVLLEKMKLDTAQAAIADLEGRSQRRQEDLGMVEKSLNDKQEALQRSFSDAGHFVKNLDAGANVKSAPECKQECLSYASQLKAELASVRSQIESHRDRLVRCLRCKSLIMGLTPEDWKRQKEEEKRQRLMMRQQALTREHSHNVNIDTHVLLQEASLYRHRATHRSRGGPPQFQADDSPASSGDDAPIYFKDPKEVVEAINGMEQENVFLMSNCQDSEMVIDEIRASLSRKKDKTAIEVDKLGQKIACLEDQIEKERALGADLHEQLRERKGSFEGDASDVAFFSLLKEAHRASGHRSDNEQCEVQILKDVEAAIDEFVGVIDEARNDGRASIVRNLERAIMAEHGRQRKMQWKDQEEHRREERMQIVHQKMQQPVFKKTGKQSMFRSPPADKAPRLAYHATSVKKVGAPSEDALFCTTVQ